MANEIQYTIGATVTKNSFRYTIPTVTRKEDLTSDPGKKVGDTQNIGTTYEALDMASGAVSSPGLALFINLDATNYVEVGKEENVTFVPFLRLYPGYASLVFLADTSLYAKANTAACDLFFEILER